MGGGRGSPPPTPPEIDPVSDTLCPCDSKCLHSSQVQDLSWLAMVVPLNGFLIFSQNIVAFSMISAVSPVSYSVANSTKRIVVICASLLLLRNPVTTWNVCGMATAVGGVAYYNKVMFILIVITFVLGWDCCIIVHRE